MKRDLCVLWELDAASRARLEELSRAAAGSPFLCTGFHPHITLGCYEGIDDQRMTSYVRRFAGRLQPFSVCFESLGLLNPELPVCFPAFRDGLKEHYFAFHRRFDNYADRWTAVAQGLYTPHVSLYCRDGMLDTAAKIRLTEAFTPFEGMVEGISLSWIRGEDDYEVIATYAIGPSSYRQSGGDHVI